MTRKRKRRHMYFLCPQIQEDDEDTLHQAAIDREILQVRERVRHLACQLQLIRVRQSDGPGR